MRLDKQRSCGSPSPVLQGSSCLECIYGSQLLCVKHSQAWHAATGLYCNHGRGTHPRLRHRVGCCTEPAKAAALIEVKFPTLQGGQSWGMGAAVVLSGWWLPH